MIIDKFISITGVCSRRETKRLIAAGRITINNTICRYGDSVGPSDQVLIDGKPIEGKKENVYIILNKPAGITCTASKEVKTNLIDYMDYPERIFAVGRLDKESDGLLLMTNDGDIVNEILRSENNHEKEYIVTVNKPITDEFIQGMSSGVDIMNTTTKPCHVSRVSDNVFRIILTQGLNRQIRRMCKVFGYHVERLQRIRIMNLMIKDLPVGEWRYLSESELSELKTLLD
ncbi:pseudouridine synthase [Anaerobacillus alkaliphilus]|uniref:Pseudouridine synthase n=1 Tax=Anaerobacillus alkaliphilus TaxID=1548597 RepID=A0A4Q0VXC3_9BACI|nr:pseudouridine synthase [Anaerobacillus alkaliphilus]RXJ04324.1 pseudouridine synthase [Anaerobacillus alkaliphilus]